MTLPAAHQLVRSHAFWLLLLGTAFLSLWQLGRLPLLDVDEPVYGEVGRLMAASGGFSHWLTPHYNGALWFDKPPLFYWLTAISMFMLGAGEAAARLPSALCAIGLTAATFALARRAYPQTPQAGVWAGFVLATGVQFFLLARAAVTDMTLALALTLALLGLYAWLETNRARWIILTGICTGLACLTKGPVALVLIGGQLIAYLALTRRWERLLSVSLWCAFALCLAVALPWFLVMIHLHGSLFVQGFLEANNVTRYLQAEHKETNNLFWYIPIFVAFFLPWTLAVPGAWQSAIARNRAERLLPGSPRPTLFMSLWCMIVFVFFSLSQTKLPTYIFLLFPAMAALVGVWVTERIAQPAPSSRSIMTAFAVFLLLMAILLTLEGMHYHAAPVTIIIWLVVLLAATGICALGRSAPLRWAAPGVAVACVLLAAWTSPTWNARAFELSETTPARFAAAAALPGAPLYALGLKHPSLVYYSRRHVVFTDDRVSALQDMAAHPDHIYLLRPVVLDELRTKYHLRQYRLRYASLKTCVISGAGRTNTMEPLP